MPAGLTLDDDELREPRLTKADTTALWYAMDAMVWQVRAMRDLPDLPAEAIEAERLLLAAARRALRKVNKLRKRQTGKA